MKVGDRRRFFDSMSNWKVTGDVGDNDIYFLPATVIHVYHRNGVEFVDIEFDHKPGRVSKGHFTDHTKIA